ncbi:MAG: TetR/AcrR family transcriptional regulator [Actinomycetia bacterium]|nr:TetR/AcrR family transcriptional regulator [Actinomycetes bacterium]
MARKIGLTLDTVVDAAVVVADRDGLDSVTLARVAEALGVKSPSLYSHVDGLAGLRRQLSFRAAAQLTAAFADAGSADGPPADRVRGAAVAYRQFARIHPGLYASMSPAPDPAVDPELAEAFADPVRLLAGLVAGSAEPELDSATVHRIRVLRSLLHGFICLELEGGFGLPEALDETFELVIDSLVAMARG